MKTVILAGLDNYVFTAADLLNPGEMKLIGFATPIEEAWNVYDNDGNIKENIEEMPVMPLAAAVELEPDCVVLASDCAEEEEKLKYTLFQYDYRGDVISLFDFFKGFSLKTSSLRRLAWRLGNLGIEGAAADLGSGRGDISWQMNALMPERRLYLFDTFTGNDARDVVTEHEKELSDARVGECSLSLRERERIEEMILSRMPYPDNVIIKKGWFPETAFDLEYETYALVHMDTGLYAPTYSGIQYFFPRMSKGGVIMVSGYESGKRQSVKRAVHDLEEKYGAFLITPLSDPEGAILISHP